MLVDLFLLSNAYKFQIRHRLIEALTAKKKISIKITYEHQSIKITYCNYTKFIITQQYNFIYWDWLETLQALLNSWWLLNITDRKSLIMRLTCINMKLISQHNSYSGKYSSNYKSHIVVSGLLSTHAKLSYSIVQRQCYIV